MHSLEPFWPLYTRASHGKGRLRLGHQRRRRPDVDVAGHELAGRASEIDHGTTPQQGSQEGPVPPPPPPDLLTRPAKAQAGQHCSPLRASGSRSPDHLPDVNLDAVLQLTDFFRDMTSALRGHDAVQGGNSHVTSSLLFLTSTHQTSGSRSTRPAAKCAAPNTAFARSSWPPGP